MDSQVKRMNKRTLNIFMLSGLLVTAVSVTIAQNRLSDSIDQNHEVGKFTMVGQLPLKQPVQKVATIYERIFCIFSGNEKEMFNGQAYEFHPDNNSWTAKRKAPILLNADYAFSTVYKNKIYLFNGRGGNKKKSGDFLVYDAIQDNWEILPDLSLARDGIGIVSANNRIYCFGGFIEKNNATNIVECFNLLTGKWESLAAKPTATGVPVCRIIGEKVICLGGYNDNTEKWLNCVEAFNLYSKTWEIKNDSLSPKFTKGAECVDNKLYVIHTLQNKDQMWTKMYDPEKNIWNIKSPPTEKRGDFASITYKNKILCIGGWIKPGQVSDVAAYYDPKRDSWVILPKLNVAKWSVQLTIWKDQLFVFGGSTTFAEDSTIRDYTVEKVDLKKYIDP